MILLGMYAYKGNGCQEKVFGEEGLIMGKECEGLLRCWQVFLTDLSDSYSSSLYLSHWQFHSLQFLVFIMLQLKTCLKKHASRELDVWVGTAWGWRAYHLHSQVFEYKLSWPSTKLHGFPTTSQLTLEQLGFELCLSVGNHVRGTHTLQTWVIQGSAALF